MRAAKVQASLRIRAVSPEPPLLAHTSSDSRGTFRQKARSLAPLNGWACVVTICHDGMLEDTNSLDGAQIVSLRVEEGGYCFTACGGRWLLSHCVWRKVAIVSLRVEEGGYCFTACGGRWLLSHCVWRKVAIVSLRVEEGGYCFTACGGRWLLFHCV